MPKLILTGRTDTADYFRISSVFTAGKLTHSPFLVFIEKDNTVQVEIVRNAPDLLSYSDETLVMGQWAGEWRSDYFQFTVGDYRGFLVCKDTCLKTATNVVKRIGRQGSFRNMTYQYIDESGTLNSAAIIIKAEALHLESVFARFGISVHVEICVG